MAMTLCAKEGIYLCNLANDLNFGEGKFLMYGDNQGAIALCKNRMVSQRSKHIGVRYHFIRDLILEGTMTVEYVCSDDNIADMFTKALQRIKLCKFRALALNDG